MKEFFEPDKDRNQGKMSGWEREVEKQRQELEGFLESNPDLSTEEVEYYRNLFDAPLPPNRTRATDGISGKNDSPFERGGRVGGRGVNSRKKDPQ